MIALFLIIGSEGLSKFSRGLSHTARALTLKHNFTTSKFRPGDEQKVSIGMMYQEKGGTIVVESTLVGRHVLLLIDSERAGACWCTQFM